MNSGFQLARTVALVIVVALLAACAARPVADPTPAVAPAPTQPSSDYIRLTPQQLNEMLTRKDFILVNVHIPYDGEIAPTDLFIPYNDIANQLDRLPDKAARIVVYCRSGPMSASAAQALVAAGYTGIMELAGGMSAWEAAGYTLVRE